ncbi:MAG: alpha/beta hydrolase, partial [Chloroflexi bacterium]|nr:alpha/beta hydrolase [Chloroflexota bacterium]
QPLTEAERAEWLAQIEAYPGNIDRPYWDREHTGLSPAIRDRLWGDWLNVSKQRMRGARAEVPDAPTELEPTLRTMQVPTLVMFGDSDHTVAPGLSAEGYLMLPSDIRHLHVIHGADHSPNSTMPRETAEVFMRFARHLERLSEE